MKFTSSQWKLMGRTIYAEDIEAEEVHSHEGEPVRPNRFSATVQSDFSNASAVELEANATLIAAAPDMYDALEQVAEWWSKNQKETVVPGCMYAVWQALNKA